MTRRLISSGSPYEAQIGYSRALVDGEWVRTVLGVAAAFGRVGVLRVLVELGVDVNAAAGETALTAVVCVFFAVDVTRPDFEKGLSPAEKGQRWGPSWMAERVT